MSGPGWSRDQVPVNMHAVDGRFDISSASEFHFRATCSVRSAASTLKQVCGSQQLNSVTDRGDGFSVFSELPDNIQYLLVKTQVLGSTASRQQQGAVVSGVYIIESGIEREVMPWFFCVSLIAFEKVMITVDAIKRFEEALA